MSLSLKIGIYTFECMEDGEGEFDCCFIERWSINGITHRETGPAMTWRDIPTGEVIKHEYYNNGSLHRDGGPAVLVYDLTTGETADEKYFQRGIQVARPQVGPAPSS